VNGDLRQFQSDTREQDQLDTVDVDLSPDILLQLLEEKIFDVIISGQVGGENEKRAAADQQNGNQGDSDTSSNHSSSLDQSSSVGKPYHFCEYAILPNHLHEIYEVCVLTGNFPLRTFNIQQDEDTSDIRVTGTTSGTGGMLKLICCVYLVHLVSLVQPNKQAKPNKPNNDLLTLADFFSDLPGTR
jgi:hypothetical protein